MTKNAGALPEVLKVGANEMELVVFKMYCLLQNGKPETRSYGVNVAKVREIIPMPTLTTVPDLPDYAEALAEVRGEVIPIIDLGKWMKLVVPGGPDAKDIRQKVIVVEMLSTTVGIVVHEVERIRRIKWTQIKPPPQFLQIKHGGRITGVTKIEENDDLLLILDLESVIQSIGAIVTKTGINLEDLKGYQKKKLSGNVLIVDDSMVARRILKDTLENIGLNIMEAADGKQALKLLEEFLTKIGDQPITKFINLVITDVEMPEMDGLTFTKSVKSDPRFKGLPVIVNTSLSGDENRQKSKVVGADGYLIKFDVANLMSEVSRFFE
ncbi:MAG: chemotaxis protein CheV [Nitrospirae bacterium]|nr:chemotaxis protein CheV [Nitrospirota bacterium]